MTAIDEQGIFYLRPLYYPDNSQFMKYGLTSSNFNPRYDCFKNPFHPFLAQPRSRIKQQQLSEKYDSLNSLPSIFDHAMIIDKKTKNTVKENRKIIPG